MHRTMCRFTILHRHLISALILLSAVFLPEIVNAQSDNKELVERLREGGYSLYFRHEKTNWSQSDHIGKQGDWLSCDGNQIRQLSSEGQQRASDTGLAIRSLGIPVAKLLVSPYCRTMETARALNLGEVEATTAVINLRVADYFGGREAVTASAIKVLASSPAPNANRIIVSHGNLAIAATGIYPEEGEAIIFLADGKGGFEFVGRLTAEAWLQITKIYND